MLMLLRVLRGSNSGGAPPASARNATFQVPRLTAVRRTAPAVALKSGDIRLVGGSGSLAAKVLASGEIYHSKTGTPVANQRAVAAKSLCLAAPNDGTALEAGGEDSNGSFVSQAEIYDPASNSFAPTSGPLNAARYGCAATTLQDGTVLTAGGGDSSGNSLDTAELYNLNMGTFSCAKGNMTVPRAFHAAVLLGDGKVLLAGGLDSRGNPLSEAELYDPTSETFTAVPDKMTSARVTATANRLGDGRVLIAGGAIADGTSVATAEPFDLKTDTFTPTAGERCEGFSFCYQPADGRVMIGGGAVLVNISGLLSVISTATVDFYEPSKGRFRAGAPMVSPHDFATATLLHSGRLLVPGGLIEGATGVGFAALETAKIYTP